MIHYSKLVIPGAALAATLALAACVTAPTDSSLLEARAAVHSAEADPAVARFDTLDLTAAQRHLGIAEDAAQHGAGALEDHESYLALRAARLAQVRADEGLAQERVASASGDRARVELASRTLDAERARETASVALATADAANRRSAAANDTVHELQLQIAGANMQDTPRGAMVILTDDYFDDGRAQLRSGANQILDGLAQFLIAHPERRVRVEGHSLNDGSSSANMALSLHRAESVRMGLVARGVDPLRSEAVAYAPASPLADAENPADRHFINGVEIVLSDSRGQIASR